MASSRPLTAASRLFSMSLRRRHHRLNSAAQSFSTAQPFPKRYTENPFGVAEDENGGRRTQTKGKVVNESIIVTRFDLPGLNPKDLSVWVGEDDELVFEGKCKSHPKYEYEGNFHSGSFRCSPMLFDKTKVKYELIHGVLWITMPLKEEAKRNINFKDTPFFK